jgi:hypothetical protein
MPPGLSMTSWLYLDFQMSFGSAVAAQLSDAAWAFNDFLALPRLSNVV